ncbi:ribonuclease H-like domain-containing protein [Tanacetum coccineum]
MMHATTTSPIPRSHLHALRDPNWHKAMVDEYNALISNRTWALVPRPANVNILSETDYSINHQASSTALLQRIITLLHSEFAMTDLGSLNYFLGVSAQRSKSGLFLSQTKFAEEILERAHMQHFVFCAYVRGTHDHDSALFHPLIQLTAYTDADWLDCLLLVGLPPNIEVLPNVVAETA